MLAPAKGSSSRFTNGRDGVASYVGANAPKKTDALASTVDANNVSPHPSPAIARVATSTQARIAFNNDTNSPSGSSSHHHHRQDLRACYGPRKEHPSLGEAQMGLRQESRSKLVATSRLLTEMIHRKLLDTLLSLVARRKWLGPKLPDVMNCLQVVAPAQIRMENQLLMF